MCWKKKPTGPTQITSNKLALLFGINDYMGTQNDLQGCLNDIDDVAKKLKNEFTDFQIVKFKDSEVTTQRFISEIENALKTMTNGVLYIHYSGHGTQVPSASEENGYNEALYLYNGPLIDDKIYELQQLTPSGLRTTAKFDSCFSGDIGRAINPQYRKSRFYQMPGVSLRTKPHNRFAKTDDNQIWLILSGCGEEQTSADAEFSGRANGAFTYFDNKSYDYYTHIDAELFEVRGYLQANNFEQRPELSGPPDRLNEIVLI